MSGAELMELPAHPDGLSWPTREWPRADPPVGVDLEPVLDAAFDPDGPLAVTQAVAVVHRGQLVAERYAGQLEFFDRPPEPVTAQTRLLSWSTAKSVLHAAVGIAARDGQVHLHAPAVRPEWQDVHDPRHEITLDTLLAMRDGLDWAEDYADERVSDVIEMLFGAGQRDTAAFAAAKPLVAPPGSRYYYSSGTSNIAAAVLGHALGPGEAYRRFLHDRLFGPIGMTRAEITVDQAGTWVASSYLHATAEDYLRFGYLYLRDGVWDGRRMLPVGWVDHGRRPRSYDSEDDALYGAHWWIDGDEHGTFSARGYEGQYIVVSPALDLVFVRFGKTPEGRTPMFREWRAAMVRAFASAC